MSITRNPQLPLQGLFGTAEGRETMTTKPETSIKVNAGSHRARTVYAKPSFQSLAPNAPSGRPNQGNHTQSTVASPGPVWHCRGPRNHDNETGDVTRSQHRSTSSTQRVCKTEFLLSGPRCPIGAAEPVSNTRNPQLHRQGPLGTAESREITITTPGMSLEVNTGQHRALSAYVNRIFTPWPQVPRRCGRTKAKHTISTVASPGLIWHCRGPRNHDNDTGDVSKAQR